jgi:hypothetical protein
MVSSIRAGIFKAPVRSGWIGQMLHSFVSWRFLPQDRFPLIWKTLSWSDPDICIRKRQDKSARKLLESVDDVFPTLGCQASDVIH